MQLDRTRITIRERSFSDILDLALRVARSHAGPLTLAAGLGMLPMALVNHWLLADLSPIALAQDLPADQYFAATFTYGYLLTMLVVLEVPLATALMTLYLGQILFSAPFRGRKLARDFVQSLPQFVLLQLILRSLLVPWVVSWFLLFVSWPYLGEIILLERNPLVRRRGASPITTFSRSMVLHAYNNGHLVARWLAVAALAPLLIVALWLSLWSLRCILAEDWTFTPAAYSVYLQVAIWAVVALLAVVRFLSYLDQRIRSEGWEVELMMRAEAARLARQVA